LKLETVSRAFSHFQDEGIIAVKTRSIEIMDLALLQASVNSSC
jgi:CRP/FNR family transcriptional regulator, anaerobic regulatory protein